MIQNEKSAHLCGPEDVYIMEEGSQTNANAPSQQAAREQDESHVYRAEDIARILDISLRAAYTLCNTTKEFRVLHIGTSIRVNKDGFDAWLNAAE